ncbi:MAG: sigma-70 family RNA polymerase sigma factor [Solirubrobacteraceae bacterium]|nr:sigma-70 family RNA polymerase sigma factor [Solirubrobacteraceae bacterium]
MTDRLPSASGDTVPAHPDDTRARVLLAMLHGARDRGDRGEALRAWRLIVEAELERVRGIVRGFRSSALPGGRVPAADVDDVAADVFMRLHDKSHKLGGRSVGELRAFMRTATQYTCRDYVRAYVTEHQRRGGSFDAEPGSSARAASELALTRLTEQLASDDDDAEIARAIIHPALALVDDDKRGVLVMTESGYTVEEMMERFGISRDNVYQRRRRGLNQLRDAIRELSGEDDD